MVACHSLISFNSTMSTRWRRISKMLLLPRICKTSVFGMSRRQVYLSFHTHIIAAPLKKVSFSTLFELYCSLRQGKLLHEWISQNKGLLGGIDVRRFISFGVIKGFLYRVHRYPILTENNNDKRMNDKSRSLRKYFLSLWSLIPRHLNGKIHMDGLCTMLECSVKDVEDQLAQFENVQWVWK